MAEITWIKLKTDMFENDKIKLIEALPDADTIIVIWIKLLASAGKANSNGYIMLTENIPMNIEEMSTIFGRPLNTVRLAIQTFRRYGMIEMDENEVVRIANWEKHQNVDGMEKIRLQTKERVAKHRAKKKVESLPEPKSNVTCNVTLTQGNATETDKDIDKDLDIDKEEDKDIEKNVGLTSSQSPLIDNNFLLIQDAFQELIREAKPQDLEKMNEALEFYETNLILEAIKEGSKKGKSFAYVLGILDRWRTEDGIKNFNDWKVKKGAKSQSGNNGQGLSRNSRKNEAEIPRIFGDYISTGI